MKACYSHTLNTFTNTCTCIWIIAEERLCNPYIHFSSFVWNPPVHSDGNVLRSFTHDGSGSNQELCIQINGDKGIRMVFRSQI